MVQYTCKISESHSKIIQNFGGKPLVNRMESLGIGLKSGFEKALQHKRLSPLESTYFYWIFILVGEIRVEVDIIFSKSAIRLILQTS